MKSSWFGDHLLWSSVSSFLSSDGGGSGGGRLQEGNWRFCSFSSQGIGSFLLLLCQHPVVELTPPSVPFTLQDLVDLLSGDRVWRSPCCCCLSSELLGWSLGSAAFIRFSVSFQFAVFKITFICVFMPASHV